MNFLPYLILDAKGKIIASCTTLSAAQAAMRLFKGPTLPVRPPSRRFVVEHLAQWEELERWAEKRPSLATPEQRNLRGDEHYPEQTQFNGPRC